MNSFASLPDSFYLGGGPIRTNLPTYGIMSSHSDSLDNVGTNIIDQFEVSSSEELPEFLEGETFSPSFDLNFSSLSGLIGGSVVSSGLHNLTEYQNQQNIIENKEGQGEFGHAFDSETHVMQENNLNSETSAIEEGMIGIGSMFGPEGLIAGVGAAAITAGVSSFIQPNFNTTMSTTGNLVNASNF